MAICYDMGMDNIMKLKYGEVDKFFTYLRERECIREHKENGRSWPWTEDLILKKFRFCNVFREDDKTTRWLDKYLREPLWWDNYVAYAIIVFRWFNRIETMERVYEPLLNNNWDSKDAERILRESGRPWTTGSYIIKTPNGMDKLSGVLWCIDQIPRFIGSMIQEQPEKVRTLQWTWDLLREYPYMGEFMAYEIVTDLRHTALLFNAPDINTWANPGPGAMRGLERLCGVVEVGHWNRGSATNRARANELMKDLLKVAPEYLPSIGSDFEIREIEHGLCEFDKYERVRLGQGRPRQVYKR